MKSPRPTLRVLILAAMLSCAAGNAAAAEEKKADAQPVSGAADEQARNQWIFNVDFPGGSLEQLVKAISASGGAIFNLIGEKADLAVQIPPLFLRNADSESLANALNQFISSRGMNIIRAQGPVMRGGFRESNFPVYTLVKRSAIDRPAFDSFQLAPYLEKQSIDDIVLAIRTLWELNPANRPEALQLKFHPPTKLLLVSGTPEAIHVAGKVISTLASPPKEPKDQKAEKR